MFPIDRCLRELGNLALNDELRNTRLVRPLWFTLLRSEALNLRPPVKPHIPIQCRMGVQDIRKSGLKSSFTFFTHLLGAIHLGVEIYPAAIKRSFLTSLQYHHHSTQQEGFTAFLLLVANLLPGISFCIQIVKFMLTITTLMVLIRRKGM